jgi:monovalent cation:proton antiporter-2 (CPA2) family protein
MDKAALFNVFVFLAAACAVVPLVSRFRLGSVLGYLAAGVLIGPFGFALIGNPEEVMHFAEFGVVMMLFLIGLELEPAMLWRMRRSIVGLGGLQVLLTSLAFMACGMMMGFGWQISLACGLALSLSSTALVLQMLQERGLMQTSAGQSSFSVLLFQDIAVIPILILLPVLAGGAGDAVTTVHADNWISELPGWAHTLVIAGVIAGVAITGKYLSRHMFRYIAQTHLRELFTATSLALVVGITLLMENVGVSPALGAFMAGVVLANSEYKHTLQVDIEPFKGLLLGLFFISVGMGMDFALLAKNPGGLALTVLGLVAIKVLVLSGLARLFKMDGPQQVLFAFALAQGGEFAFVLFPFLQSLYLMTAPQANMLTLAVALSMALTPLLLIIYERYILPHFMSRLPERAFDTIEANDNPIIIAGYGRFGQIIGRFLTAQGIKATILEKDPDEIELLRKFGNKVYFGDASHPELLKSAGAATAKILIVAIDDADKAIEIVRYCKKEFPHLKIFARARNRRHAYELNKAGADYYRREVFDSAMTLAQEVMKGLGHRAFAMRHKAKQFMRHDENTLKASFSFFEKEPELISYAQQASHELENILHSDVREEDRHIKRNDGWEN